MQVGRSIPRFESRAKVTGRAEYVHNLRLPGIVIDVFVALKTHDTAPYILDTRLWYLNSIASVSKAWLDSLPPDLQEAVKQTGVDLEDEMFQWQLEQDEANRATWKEQGGTITPLSDEDREEAEAAVAQVTEAFLERHPELRETYDLLGAKVA